MHEAKEPTVREEVRGNNDAHKVFSHDAYGMVSLTTHTGGGNSLFGSDINHGQCLSIRICRAELIRDLSNDWFHAASMPIVEINLSHSQFAQFITSGGVGEGIPCTITYAPAVGTPTKLMPSIAKIESKAETFRTEIKESTRKALAKLKADVAEIEAELNATGTSKKRMKELIRNMQIVMGNMPANLAFSVEQAEEALEKAVTASKIDVEAYIANAITKLGHEAAKNIGLLNTTADMPVLIEGEKGE